MLGILSNMHISLVFWGIRKDMTDLECLFLCIKKKVLINTFVVPDAILGYIMGPL